MSPTTRGYVIAAASIGLFALAVVWTTRRPERPAPLALDAAVADAGRPWRAPLQAGACKSIAARYEGVIDGLRACSTAADCVVEDRSGFYASLDGCYRILGKDQPKTAADQLAVDWLSGGCVHDLPACEKKPIATCRAGKCVELPPAPVPAEWRRERVPGLLTMFLPPDFVRVDVMGEDSFVLGYQGKGRTISMEVGPYAPDPSPDAHMDSAPWDDVLPAQSLVVAGRAITLQRYALKARAGRPSWTAQARIPNVAEPFWAMFGAGASQSNLFFALDCDTLDACAAAPVILGSLEVLSESILP